MLNTIIYKAIKVSDSEEILLKAKMLFGFFIKVFFHYRDFRKNISMRPLWTELGTTFEKGTILQLVVLLRSFNEFTK